MTSETIMQVLMVYPDARCIFCEKSDVWCVVKTHLGGAIGEGNTQPEAWDDAASRLTETELPSSPAGDEEDLYACSFTEGGEHAPSPVDANSCIYCAGKGRPHRMRNTEPLGADISGPKGSGGAAPEAAEDDDFDPNVCVHGVYVRSPCVECEQEYERKSAAPIAPAAQELIELLQKYRIQHKECKDLTGHPDALKSQRKDWRCDLCKQVDPYLLPEKVDEPEAGAVSDTQVKHMVDRFLGWKLPENFNPDGGISFKKLGNENTPHQYKNQPTGTNLLDAVQAEEMVRYILARAERKEGEAK